MIGLACLIGFSLHAQTYNIGTQSGQTFNTCSGTLYTSGGAVGGYGNNENNSITFCSNSATNTQMQLYFNSFDVDPSDTLWIHDGPNTSAPLIVSGNTIQNFFNNSNSLNLFPVQSTTSGCLTLAFKSDAANTGNGWDASISCVNACQPVFAGVDTVLTTPLVNDSNYIDVCFGDTVTFVGKGIYPMNGVIYQQSDATSTFIWNFGDGVVDTGQTIQHVYNAVRGYDVMLTVIDSNGCVSTNAINLRVRISGNPIKALTLPDAICANDPTELVASDWPNMTNVYYQLTESNQSSSQSFDSTMFIPDGPNCPVQCYDTDVNFNSFLPGQTISAASDILSICVNMEHSFVGDLEFTIICPNGQSAILKTYINSGGAFMGVPLDGAPWDNSTFPCDPAQNAVGVGWNYCWSQIYPTIGTINAHSSQAQLDSTNTVNNTGYYDPDQPFSNLIGCPLNGTWSIEICDNWAIDNGYIFSWDLNLDPNLLPTNWTYKVDPDTMLWTGPFIDSVEMLKAYISPDIGGNYNYGYTFVDEYGCHWDTIIPLEVIHNPIIDLGADTSICEGDSVLIDAGAIPAGTYSWYPSGSTNQTVYGSTPGLYIVKVTNTQNGLNCVSKDTIEIFNYQAPSVSFFVDRYNGCEPLTVNFTENCAPAIAQYNWNFGDGGTSTVANPTYIYNTDGVYDISLSVVSVDGCPGDITIPDLISVYSSPIVDYFVNPQIANVDQIVTFTDMTLNPMNWFWDFGDGNTSTVQNPTHSYPNVGDYYTSLVVTTDKGCSDSAMHLVRVFDAELTIPNIITPNGDGYNDKFVIENLLVGGYETKKIRIYNRWGGLVYKSDDYQNDWDGGDLSEGTYYFTLEALGLIRDYITQGTITILRN